MGNGYSAQADEYKAPTQAELVPYDEKEGPFWRVEVDATRPIRVAETGIASKPPVTVLDRFRSAVEKSGANVAFEVERPVGTWVKWTWQQYYDDVMTAARAFIKLGHQEHQAVNIMGFNSPEWFIANMAAVFMKGKGAGIYGTNGPEACKYISAHSEASFVVVESKSHVDRFLQIRDDLPLLKAIICWGCDVPEGANEDGKVPVMTWADFLKHGAEDDEENKQVAETLAARQDSITPELGCTLIYTSGTTGPPKAVMLSHDNLTWTSASMVELLPECGQHEEAIVSYLPLSHVAAQMMDIYTPLVLAARGAKGVITFARPDALKGTLKDTLVHARPTFFFGVPRVWEKFKEGMAKMAAKTTGLKKSFATWAKNKGAIKYQATQVDGNHKLPFGISIAEKLFGKIKSALGLDRARMFMTGAAPIAKEVLQYFGQLDMPIVEIYGMSESSGPHTSGRFGYFKMSSCGVPIPGAEIKIDHNPDRDQPGNGEICYRGRHVMMGYMKNAEKTQQTIDDEGWLHSGDVGRIDDDHCLFITGRIKELIITAGGENVAPVPIEDQIKENLPGISNIMMVGDQRKYNTCLITLRQELDQKTGEFNDNLDGASLEVNPEVKTVTDAMADEKWHNYIVAGIKKFNEAAVSRAQKIQYYRICPVDFSVPGGELTPTLKLKRPVVTKKYADLIEEMYGDSPMQTFN